MGAVKVQRVDKNSGGANRRAFSFAAAIEKWKEKKIK